MTDIKYSIDQINSEIGKLLAESNLEELTPKIVRRKLEERLKYEEFSLDEEEPRTLIKGILDEFVARVQQAQEKEEQGAGNFNN
ncbi:hypothetical protein CONCODRAFT_108242 [Conidiobolus coronatus NRRL 28638]|uniref:DEK-C domain-containing protein n=1 Tax=Conidiobolus coronatus (strain ATCC 28846 / CBS 209.66 / NRRL 28638) TaxID=796925 RepID=A0A137NZ76_CONC2|nr:hypothetical protein CONCODRAFT_108242 [Conidiobolus coronatus NRRL 28638]|eukprot:KXN68116.1 hypothetical protein CONCODRAFT_108242 [Conidiobolus coronatus NRRL 28638]